MLGPLFFSLNAALLSKIIALHPDIKFQFYADDTQLYVQLSHKNASAALACLQDVQQCMAFSKFKLNRDKTEFIVFGSQLQHQKISSHFPVSILGSLLHPVIVKNLGVLFNVDTFRRLLKPVSPRYVTFIELESILFMKWLSMLQMPLLVVVWTIYNSLFRGLSYFNLQSIRNTLSYIVENHRKYAHATPLLNQLHWLPVN